MAIFAVVALCAVGAQLKANIEHRTNTAQAAQIAELQAQNTALQHDLNTVLQPEIIEGNLGPTDLYCPEYGSSEAKAAQNAAKAATDGEHVTVEGPVTKKLTYMGTKLFVHVTYRADLKADLVACGTNVTVLLDATMNTRLLLEGTTARLILADDTPMPRLYSGDRHGETTLLRCTMVGDKKLTPCTRFI